MIIVHIGGGFGNQLFTYAFGYALAKERNEALFIDTAIQDAEWFFRKPLIMKMNIQYSKRITYRIGRSILERGFLNKIRYKNQIGWFTKEIREEPEDSGKFNSTYLQIKDRNVYMRGDWQSEKYFSKYKHDIIDMFSFKEDLSAEAGFIAREIEKIPNSVTIHCRRGDYVELGICAPETYYLEAMRRLADMLDQPIFYCFSEDLEWAKETFGKTEFDIRYPTYQSSDRDIEDFRLISMGHHMILSNSSYSWWAAYLNRNKDATIICPDMPIGTWHGEFWPADWTQIECYL